jgi:hypothetical protein
MDLAGFGILYFQGYPLTCIMMRGYHAVQYKKDVPKVNF